MKKETKDKLLAAWQYCDEHDKSTEFMLQYMQDVAGVDLDCVVNFMEKTTNEQRQQFIRKRAETPVESRWIKADGSQRIVVPENGKEFQLKEMQKFVGGLIEIVPLGHGMIMVLNEEGKLNELPFNELATRLFLNCLPGRNDFIVGDVLVCHQNLVK